MSKLKHLVIGASEEMLPRWFETFSDASTVNFGDILTLKFDIVWLKLDGFESAKPQIDWLVKYYPSQPFVVMSSIPLAKEGLLALSLGARAYVNCHAGPTTLKQIARILADGGMWIDQDLMQLMTLAVAGQNTEKAVPSGVLWREKLSSREIEVAEAIEKGASNKVIARALNISERTVKAHVTSIFEKLGVTDRLNLVILLMKK